MRVDEYARYDGMGLAELIRGNEISASEVYAAAIEAMAMVNPAINAIADGPWETPLEHSSTGVFAGVPFVLKDLSVHAKGVPMRMGSRLTGAGITFDHDSFLVERFRAAGLAAAALTTTPEFGGNVNTEAVIYGSTRNPWDLNRSAGGSSGGTAALVAAGAVPFGHGGDGAGSIRVPAAFNGLVGLKPSRGRISDGPDAQESVWGFATEFAITRTVRDCAALLDATAGAMPGDKFIIKEPVRPWSDSVGAEVPPLRVALHTDSWADSPVDREVVAAVEAVGRQLEQLGHVVEPAAPVLDPDSFLAAQVAIFNAEGVKGITDVAEASGRHPGPDTLEHTTLISFERGRSQTMLEIATAQQTVNDVARTFGAFFGHWDLLVTPTFNVPPLPLGYLNANDRSLDLESWAQRHFDVCSFTSVFNWTGTPAMSLPLGWTSHGVPIGVQIAARMCEEDTLIRVASQLEEAMPWRERRPPVHAAYDAAAYPRQ